MKSHLSLLSLLILLSEISLGTASNSIRIGWSAFPSSPLYYIGYDDFSQTLTESLFEPLIELSQNDLSPQGRLAIHWKISKDHLKYQFTLNKNAKFSDETPLKASDVCFTFNWIRNSSHSPSFKEKFSVLLDCKVLNTREVEFQSKEARYETLNLFTELFVLPEKSFRKFKSAIPFDSQVFGSGPYQILKIEKPSLVILKKNPKYWGQFLPINQNRFHFEELSFKAISDPQMLHQHLLRHEIDYMYFLSSKMWAADTQSEPYNSGKIKKIHIKNNLPHSTVGIAWNLRRPLFQNLKVRRALAHLLNRKGILKELMFNAYIPATGIAHSLSDWHHPQNLAVEYSPTLAIKLLNEAGWSLKNNSLVDSAGRPFKFEILISNAGSSKYLTWYQEDLKKVGIEMQYRVTDWASFLKHSREGNFDGIESARERDLIPHGFRSTWASENATQTGSGNTTGYQNESVDSLIQKIEKTFSQNHRKKLLQDLDLLLGQDQPMNFLWEPTYTRIAHWDEFSYEGNGYLPYSTWKSIFHYWKKKPQSKLAQNE